jgi:GrpB-like predicted nucleotidyltransferase (UPF0157 family)
MERYGGGPIVIADYDAAWPSMFEAERSRIQRVLGSTATAIEHVGSTAVPGLGAKPIVDILVGVTNLEPARTVCVARLTGLGYTHMAAYEAWLPGEMLFRKAEGGRWTHHVHVTQQFGPRWEEFVLIRDYLRRDAEAAHDYEDLKKALATTFGDDIQGFREAKRPLLEKLMLRARHDEAAG